MTPRSINADAIYCEIGKIVVCFQWLENLWIQIGCFLDDPNCTNNPGGPFSAMRFQEITNRVEALLLEYLDQHLVDRPDERKEQVRELAEECRSIARERNRLLHSFFLHLEAGGELVAIVRSKVRKQKTLLGQPCVSFDQEDLTENSFELLLERISKVGLPLGQLHVQLLHWHGRIKKKSPGMN